MRIEITEVDPQLVAATRTHTNRNEIGAHIGAGFGALMQTLAEEGVAASGAPMVVYHNWVDDEQGGDIEVCIPIGREISGNAQVSARTLDGGAMATAVHQGPYSGLRSVFEALMAWISEHDHESVGPPREIYLNDPQTVTPEELLTRVEFPVAPGNRS